MITEKFTPASHAGEDQSSAAPVSVEFATRQAHWASVQRGIEVEHCAAGIKTHRAPWLDAAVGLLDAAKKLTGDWPQDENDDAEICASPAHHAAIRALFDAVAHAEAVDLVGTGALKDAALIGEPRYWLTNFPDYDGKSAADLIGANARAGFPMRPGDSVYVAEIRRHVLTTSDFNQAYTAPAATGGAA